MLGVLMATHDIHEKTSQLEADMLTLQRPSSAQQKTQKDDPAKQLEFAAVRVAMSDLSMPWQPLFKTLEKLQFDNIRLTAIEPNPKLRKLKLSGNAQNAEAMFAYMKALRAQPLLKDAFLQGHEYQPDQQTMPISFVIETPWIF